MADRPHQAGLSDDAALDGRLRLLQPRRGHRFGHDAILLAAAVGRAGRVVDLGAGVGAAGLAVATRLKTATVVLVERDPALTALADENVRRNELAARARAVALDVGAPAAAFADAGLGPDSADAVIMNPPFNDAARQKTSPDTKRAGAHVAAPDSLHLWCGTARRLLAPGGTLTLIWRAEGLGDVLAALARGFGGPAVVPIHPRPDRSAIRILVAAVKGAATPLRLLPGVFLNDSTGQPTPAAEAVLRGGQPLAME